jgi:hypothetical protein
MLQSWDKSVHNLLTTLNCPNANNVGVRLRYSLERRVREST